MIDDSPTRYGIVAKLAGHPRGSFQTGVSTASPAKCRVALSTNICTDAATASGDRPPTCGVSTTRSEPVSNAGGAGSPS
jgi:hypothetical protein